MKSFSLWDRAAFAPETLTANRGNANAPIIGHGTAGALYVVHGHYELAANVEDGDIFEMCWTPAKFLCLGGQFTAADLDTGTEVLDMDLGWDANGGSSETYVDTYGVTWTNAAGSADPDGLINMGVLTGDAIATDLVAAGVNWRPLILPKPLFFSRPTLIQVEANVAANAGGTGNMTVALWGQIIG